MQSIKNNPGIAAVPHAGRIPHAVLDHLAARLRPAGLCLLVLTPEGALAWHDAAAPAFFQKLVKPQLEHADAVAVDPALRDAAREVNTTSGVCAWKLPGVELAAFPHVEKRKLAAIIVIAAKSAQFTLADDVARACSRLAVDPAWLQRQAEELPAYCPTALTQQAKVLVAMLRDQLRVSCLEQELDSISGQLSNTYEELSLIYQISSGMKINRRSSDFFKQTCLDVMQVLGVRAMGPGWKQVRIAPRPLKLDFARGQVPTPHGMIRVEWEKAGDDQLAVRVELPEPITAEFLDPLAHVRTLTPGSHEFHT